MLYSKEVRCGHSVQVAIGGCGIDRVRDPVWRVLDGPGVAPTSGRSQAVSFIAPAESQGVSFGVDYIKSDGGSATEQVTLPPCSPGPAAIAVRGEPSVYAGGATSLRAWLDIDASEGQPEVTWQQVGGPQVKGLDRSNPLRIVFSAPQTDRDIGVTFRATVRTRSGRVDTDDFSVLVQALPSPPQGQLFQGNYSASRVYPYRRTSPYAQVLAECVYSPALTAGASSNRCTLGKLPLLARDSHGAMPSFEQVMDRVLVSNDWMGDAFERFLKANDVHGDLRRMLNATTAIVIGGRVRPSFYWDATGAIYLDADSFWTTPEERDTISERPDFRAGFADNLQFLSLYRYVLGNKYAGTYYRPTERRTRPIESLVYDAGRLLYHELTHANDAFNPAIQTTVKAELRVDEASPQAVTSTRLYDRFGFTSLQMLALGRVMYRGVEATPEQKGFQAADVGRFFSADRVTDSYAYSVEPKANPPISFEDTAMLAEEFWMAYRHGVRRDVAMTNTLTNDSQTARDLIVAWGQRGRIGASEVRERVAFVLSEVAPWLPADAVQTLPEPVLMASGKDWVTNLDLASIASAIRPQAMSDEDRALRSQQADAQLQAQWQERAGHLRRPTAQSSAHSP